MSKDCGLQLTRLQVDGGMTANNLLMQTQADLVGIPVSKCCYGHHGIITLKPQLFSVQAHKILMQPAKISKKCYNFYKVT
jgi:hypothetical protein